MDTGILGVTPDLVTFLVFCHYLLNCVVIIPVQENVVRSIINVGDVSVANIPFVCASWHF